MARKTSQDFPARISVDLAKTHSLPVGKGARSLHVCLDKTLRRNAVNHILFGLTPYRCSLGRPKECRQTRGAKNTRSTDSQWEDCLPRLPQVRESLTRRNSSEKDERDNNVNGSPFHPDSEGETDKCFPFAINDCEGNYSWDFLPQCPSERQRVSRHSEFSPTFHDCSGDERGSKSLPLIKERNKRHSEANSDPISSQTQAQTYRDTKLPRLENFIHLLDEQGSSNEEEFSHVMEDGSKVTSNRQKLSIEVFLPRIW